MKFQLFDRLKQEQPNALEKLTCVYGDVTLLNLGIIQTIFLMLFSLIK